MNSHVIQACLEALWIAPSLGLGAPAALSQQQPAETGRASHFAGKLSSLAALNTPGAKDLGSQAAASWNQCCQSHRTPLRTQATYFVTETFPKRNVLRIFCSQNNLK